MKRTEAEELKNPATSSVYSRLNYVCAVRGSARVNNRVNSGWEVEQLNIDYF